jgi:hypothetical protein
MEFINFLGAIGIGAVIVKILDIFWLQKIISRNETTKWLREQRLKYFSEFAEYCETLSLRKKDSDVLDFVALGAKLKLLIGTEELLQMIDDIVDRVCDLHSSQEEINMETIHKLQQKSRKLVSDLRYELLKEPNADSFIAIFFAKIRKITTGS